MRHVAISQLKAKLSEYLKAVRAGEEVVVTNRGVPVAKLSGIAGSEARDGHMRRLVRSGQARPAEVDGGIDLERMSAVREQGHSAGLADAVLAEREEGR